MSGVQMILLGVSDGGGSDIQTVTIGTYIDKFNYFTGYISALSTGGISDGTFNPTGGTTISGLYYDQNGGYLYFLLAASPISNSGWSTMTLNGNPFTRSSATFNSTGGSTSWAWASASNPFPFTATTTAVFT
jgi:hypothetical protein